MLGCIISIITATLCLMPWIFLMSLPILIVIAIIVAICKR